MNRLIRGQHEALFNDPPTKQNRDEGDYLSSLFCFAVANVVKFVAEMDR